MLRTWFETSFGRLRRIAFSEAHSMLLWAAAAGLVGALATHVFREGIRVVEELLTGHSGSLVELAKRLPWYLRLCMPAIGGVVAGCFLVLSNRLATKVSSDYMEAIAIGDGRIPVRESLLRSLSSLSTIASGGAIGREGSMVQLAAMCASFIGRLVRFDLPRLRLLVACGAAAGITSAYNTPLAGAFFVTEIVLGSIVMESFAPIVVASVVANITMHGLPGYHPTYEMPLFPAIFGVEIGLFVIMGVLIGIAAPGFLAFLAFSKRQFVRSALPMPLRLGLGGLGVGMLSVLVPQVWGNGYSVVNALLHEPWVWWSVVMVLVSKIIATALTTGSGAVGGVFTPTLFVGAALGWLFGAAAHTLFPHVTSAPFAYAIVGMGAFLAAATSAPMMAILMIFEMTLSYQVVLPLMLACVIAHLITRSLNGQPMYAITNRRNQEEKERLRLRGIHMRDLIKPAVTVLPLEATIAELSRMFLANSVKFVYIVNDSTRFQGVVALSDVTSQLLADDEARQAQVGDFLCRDRIHLLTPEMTLDEGLRRFLAHQGERLPVVQSLESPILLGVVYKSALLEACFLMSA
jgi:CIC family chloride channel protein